MHVLAQTVLPSGCVTFLRKERVSLATIGHLVSSGAKRVRFLPNKFIYFCCNTNVSREEWHLLGCNAMQSELYRRFGGTYCLHLQDRKVRQASSKQHAELCACCSTLQIAYLAYTSILKVEVIRSSETSLKIYRTA
jgi:hypothetical protein